MTIAHIIRKKLDQLQREGFSLDELNDWYQIRVNERLDVYPRNRRFHDLHTGQRGGYENSFDDFIRWFFKKGPGGNTNEAHSPIEVRVHGGMVDLLLPKVAADPIYNEARKFVHDLFPGPGPDAEFLAASSVDKITDFFLERLAPARMGRWTCSTCQRVHPGKCPAESGLVLHGGIHGGPRYSVPVLSRFLSRFFGA